MKEENWPIEFFLRGCGGADNPKDTFQLVATAYGPHGYHDWFISDERPRAELFELMRGLSKLNHDELKKMRDVLNEAFPPEKD
jgi:uncharacterized protein (DUF3820 family)